MLAVLEKVRRGAVAANDAQRDFKLTRRRKGKKRPYPHLQGTSGATRAPTFRASH